MGELNTSGTRHRDDIRDGVAYEPAICSAMGMSSDTLICCDQIGLAMIRLDGESSTLSRLADKWVGDEITTFLDSRPVRQASHTTDPGAQWDYTNGHGRVIRMRRVDYRDITWLAFHDVTLEADHETVMKDVGAMGTGFMKYNMTDGHFRLFGDFLDHKLTPNEQLDIRRNGLTNIIHPRDKARCDALIENLMKTGEPVATVIECSSRREASFRLDIRLRAVHSSGGEICKIIGSFRDVTAERSARAELIRLRNEREANTEAQTFMLARITHEIRTPMSGVMGMADALLNMPGTEEFREQLRILQSATRDAFAMLDRTSALSKMSAPSDQMIKECVNISNLVSEATELWRARADGNGTRITLRVSDDLPDALLLDGRRLRQCLNNLLSNAVKFTKNGVIQVVAASVERDGRDHLVIAVRDSGIGMSVDEQSNVFRPYAQANPQISKQYGGSGLGMAITRDIISRMSGRISCKSEAGKGTTFSLLLPMERAKVSEPSNDLVTTLLKKSDDTHDGYGHLRVLCVDDNETNRLVVEQLLRDRVSSITLASNGREALAKLADEPFDVVLMDIHMPVMDGIEATLAIRSARATYSDVPIVALTADSQYQSKRVALNLGMDEALPKPISIDALLSVFEKLKLDVQPNLKRSA